MTMNKFTLTLFTMAFAAVSMAAFAQDVPVDNPRNHEPVKASVVSEEPSAFTIDVHSLANIGVDQGADTFAVYTSGSLPETCADYSSTELTYTKPTKYERQFNLSENPEIIEAINTQRCVIVPNIPTDAAKTADAE